MRAAKGDWLLMHGSTGSESKVARVEEVLGGGDDPLYRVAFENGREAIVAPGPHARVCSRKKPRAESIRADGDYL
ncbi:DUF1918 domain-containing protein [Streptomyces sp. V3I7]|uniref:DUF1918 domain-containing protein n=1 Tax=Streptomyces sp. V3I7 TaxID=3042278 RepID=UPI002782F808|nr:DUF1918 domain-containing protein [Streptomyces sp. V3I7]MDQ0994615.1 hypothetical protein [Streptomyces sp. V3I7]